MKQATGAQIRKVREMLSIPQEHVARQLGISQAAYSNIENGKTIINERKLYCIASALDVTAELILRFDMGIALDACLGPGSGKRKRKRTISRKQRIKRWKKIRR